ncbi:MAG: helix-turn-helix transcriptional regulator [Epsilonproteobacteria bacterium]|nr:helix-turn-helix transcriptional regulator [Campylobacterota bacterium]
MTLGEKIKFFRESRGLNLSELAKKAGVAKSTLFKIEENKTNPTINTVWAISKILGVSFGELAGESEIKGDGVSVLLLEKTKDFESYKMNLRPNAQYIAKPHSNAKEKIYVISGEVEVGDIKAPKRLYDAQMYEFMANKKHIYKAFRHSVIIVSIHHCKNAYFQEDIFVDVFDKEVYERLNKFIKNGVGIIRVIAKVDKFDAPNVVKNDFGIFIYGSFNFQKNTPLSIKDYEKSVILQNADTEIIHAAYFALIDEIELAKEYALQNPKIKRILCG